MAKRLQLRRGTEAEHALFIGAVGEVTVDTTNNTLRVHDGITAGGHVVTGEGGNIISDAVVEFVTETPTSCSLEGKLIYNTSNGKLYTCADGEYLDMIAAYTPDAPEGIEVVSSLPTTGNYPDRTVFLTTDNKLYKYVNGAFVAVVQAIDVAQEVADGSITTAKFAQGIRPVEIVSSLPSSGNFAGRTAFLTTDNKLYRHNGTSWTAAVAATDLSGTVSTSQIADDAITADKLAANSVVAGTIAAGAVSATEIASGAISTAKLAAGAITTDKIAALAVETNNLAAYAITSTKLASDSVVAGKVAAAAIGTTQLQASAITSDKLASNSVVAGKIAAGSIGATEISAGSVTVDRLTSSASTFNGVVFRLGSGASVAGYSAGGAFQANSSSVFGLIAANPAGPALGCGTTGSTAACAGFYNSTDSNYTSHRTYAEMAYATWGLIAGHSSGNITRLASSSYAAYLTGAIGPFTGSHDALIANDTVVTVGDILVDSGMAIKKSINDCITEVVVSSQPNQKGVVGVYVKTDPDHLPVTLSRTVVDVETGQVSQILDEQYEGLIAANNVCIVNSLGEGLVNACGENGDIAVGDLIVASSIPGKGMKQSDDIVRSYTVAKARESVTFTQGEIKQIACIYLAG